MNDESVETWARSADFGDPPRLGEVEAGVLARKPLWEDRPGAALVAVSWIAGSLAWLLGYGAPILGLLLVFRGTREGSDLRDTWLTLALVLFVGSAYACVSLLLEMRRTRRRMTVDWASMLVVLAACVAAYAVLDRAEVQVPRALEPAVAVVGVVALVTLVLSLISRPAPSREKSRTTPPLRGPRGDAERFHYRMTRERVLDILVERRLLDLDPVDRQRLGEMPLGYWEELDGVDDAERRRILQNRASGWRTFDESDERPWPPTGSLPV